jgi:hypothetical protein
MRLLNSAAHWVAMPLAHTVPDVNEIQMSVYLHNVDGSEILEGSNARDVNGVIAPEGHWQRATLENVPDCELRISMAAYRVGMNNVCVTDIDNADAV